MASSHHPPHAGPGPGHHRPLGWRAAARCCVAPRAGSASRGRCSAAIQRPSHVEVFFWCKPRSGGAGGKGGGALCPPRVNCTHGPADGAPQAERPAAAYSICYVHGTSRPGGSTMHMPRGAVCCAHTAAALHAPVASGGTPPCRKALAAAGFGGCMEWSRPLLDWTPDAQRLAPGGLGLLPPKHSLLVMTHEVRSRVAWK